MTSSHYCKVQDPYSSLCPLPLSFPLLHFVSWESKLELISRKVSHLVNPLHPTSTKKLTPRAASTYQSTTLSLSWAAPHHGHGLESRTLIPHGLVGEKQVHEHENSGGQKMKLDFHISVSYSQDVYRQENEDLSRKETCLWLYGNCKDLMTIGGWKGKVLEHR